MCGYCDHGSGLSDKRSGAIDTWVSGTGSPSANRSVNVLFERDAAFRISGTDLPLPCTELKVSNAATLTFPFSIGDIPT